MSDFMIPPNHVGFKAKKLNGQIAGNVTDCAIAFIEPGGGGPDPSHTHPHDHFFIVVEGWATIQMGNEKVKVNTDESIMVPGEIIHSIWNESAQPLKMIGLTINHEDK